MFILLMEIAESDGLSDGCHLNDLGFYSMTKAYEKVLKDIFK